MTTLQMIKVAIDRHDAEIQERQERAAMLYGHYPNGKKRRHATKKHSCKSCKECNCHEKGLALEDF